MKVLFGVSDWGLGHATRSIPLISALLKKGDEVHIVSAGRAMKLLKNYFRKKCIYFDIVLEGAIPRKNISSFILNSALSFFSVLKNLTFFRNRIKTIIKKEKYDLVVSDCRADVYDRPDNSILINHQLRFRVPFLEVIVELILGKLMGKYGKVIVPDFPGRELSGDLSYNRFYEGEVHYIGILSHVKKKKMPKDIDFFVTLSGPEPWRGELEKKIREQVLSLKGKIVVALAKPEQNKLEKTKNVTFYSFLKREKQAEMMNRAKFIITRSGYTTVMEVAEIGNKNVLFIPTPGQTEQEYLGDYYENRKYFHHTSQNDLNLQKDIRAALNFKGLKCPWKTEKSIKNAMKVICESERQLDFK
ncbi:MAG: glycosyltransferase family protein [Nanoarchaeota archaeon]|nr:glycosyltransferase family protein [Nanoarchaeota archaeon]